LVLIGNDIAKITARRRGYEICSSVAEEDPNTLPSDPINIYWHGRIKPFAGVNVAVPSVYIAAVPAAVVISDWTANPLPVLG
jgi:hypothetical protein